MSNVYTTSQVADAIGVSPSTVRSWKRRYSDRLQEPNHFFQQDGSTLWTVEGVDLLREISSNGNSNAQSCSPRHAQSCSNGESELLQRYEPLLDKIADLLVDRELSPRLDRKIQERLGRSLQQPEPIDVESEEIADFLCGLGLPPADLAALPDAERAALPEGGDRG